MANRSVSRVDDDRDERPPGTKQPPAAGGAQPVRMRGGAAQMGVHAPRRVPAQRRDGPSGAAKTTHGWLSNVCCVTVAPGGTEWYGTRQPGARCQHTTACCRRQARLVKRMVMGVAAEVDAAHGAAGERHPTVESPVPHGSVTVERPVHTGRACVKTRPAQARLARSIINAVHGWPTNVSTAKVPPGGTVA